LLLLVVVELVAVDAFALALDELVGLLYSKKLNEKIYFGYFKPKELYLPGVITAY